MRNHGLMQTEIVVARDPHEAASAAAALLVEAAAAGGAIVLAGGSTPRHAYELAAEALPDWGRASLWFGDERCVPADDSRSNHRLVAEALLQRLAVLPAVHPVPTELPALEAAAVYDGMLRGVTLDLALLGLGADGHTASLFPHASSLAIRDRLAVAAAPGLDPLVERVTLTIPALASAASVVFLAVGSDKADAARRAFAAPPSEATPASLVRSRRGTTTVVLDEAAARLLS